MEPISEEQKQFNDKLETLEKALVDLSIFWEQHPDIESGDYPAHWGSLDEETCQVQIWANSVK